MSTKTLRKRIALVAVSALGAGLLSVAPANAADANAYLFGVSAASVCATSNSTTGAALSTTDLADTGTLNGYTNDADGVNLTMPVGATFVLGLPAGDSVVVTGPVAAINLKYATANDAATQSLNNAGKVVIKTGGDDSGAIQMTALAVGSAKLVVDATGSITTDPTSTTATSINISIVAACVTDTVSATRTVYQIGETAETTVALGANQTTYAAGSSAYISIKGLNGYKAALPAGSWTATATNGALVALDDDATAIQGLEAAGLYPFANEPSFVGSPNGTDAGVFVRIDNPGTTALSTTVSVTYKGQVVATADLKFHGEATKINIIANAVGKSGAEGMFWYTLEDAAGNSTSGSVSALVTSYTNQIPYVEADDTVLGKYATLSGATATGTVSGIPLSALGSVTYGVGVFTCGSTSGSSDVTVRHYQPITGAYITKVVTLACAGGLDTYTVSMDKASYKVGEIATLTITAKDSSGKASNDFINTNGAAFGGNAADISVGGGSLTKATAGTDTFGILNGLATGTKTYKIQLTTAGSFNTVVNLGGSTTKSVTVGYTVSSGGSTLEDVLKAIVSLIASINKQIAALQKALLKKK